MSTKNEHKTASSPDPQYLSLRSVRSAGVIMYSDRSSSHPISLDLAIERDPLIVQSDDPVSDVIDRMSQAQGSNCALSNVHLESPTVSDASTLLATSHRRSSYALVMAAHQLVGIFTERDLVKLAAAAVQLESATIRDVMTPDVITLQAEADQNLFTARAYFRQHKIRHLPVLDTQRQLLGVITSESLRQALQPLCFMTLKQVKDVMTPAVLHAPTIVSVRHLAQLMVERRVSCVVIADVRASASSAPIQPVGIVTERDIVQFQALDLDLDKMQASQVMSTPLIPLTPEDSLWRANQLMQQRHVGRLVVIDSEGGLAGVVTQSNLLQLLEPVEMLSEIEALQKKQDIQAAELRQTNQRLQAEIAERTRLENALRQVNQLLEKAVDRKTGELLTANTQLDTERQLAAEEARCQYERSQLLSEMTLKIRQSLNIDDILETAATEVKQFLRADRVLVFKLKSKGMGTVMREAVNDGLTATSGFDLFDPCLEHCVEQYQKGRISAIEDIDRVGIQPCHAEFLKQFEVKANLVVPILQQNTLWGLLISHQCDRPRQWTELETDLLRQVADQIGIALSQSQLLHQLEQQVEARTAELSCANSQLQQEIDERLQAEALLRQSEEKFRTLVTNLPEAVYRCIPGKGWTVEFISEMITRISGYSVTDFIQNKVRTLDSIIHPDDREQVKNEIEEAIAKKRPYHLHCRIINVEGETRWVAKQGQGICDPQSGELLYRDGTIVDITEYKQVTQTLKESEAKYRALVETAQSIIWVTNAEGCLSFINSTAAQIYGYEPEAMLGRRLFEDFNVPPSTAETSEPPLQTLFSQGTSVQFERTHRSKTGQSIHLLFNAIALKDAGGNISEITGTASDITDLKWEDALQKIRNDVLSLLTQNRSLFEILLALVEQINRFLPSVDSTIMLLQADGQHLQSFVGPSMPSAYMQSIVGLSIGPNVGSCGTAAYLQQRVIAEDIATDPAWQDYREFVLPLGFKACWSDPIKSVDGRLLGTFGMYFREVRSPVPRELKLIGACSDLASIVITRKQADEALRTSEAQLRLTTDALPAFISYVDNQQRYRFVNKTYEASFGIPREHMIGKHVCTVLGETLYKAIQPCIEQALSGQKATTEETVVFKDQSVHHLSGTYIPHISTEGAVNGYFFLANDISQQKAVERMKNEFISVVSHELRTPLTSIYGSLKLLKITTESRFSEDDLGMLNIAVSSSERLIRLVNDILDLEKIESGQVTLDKQACDATNMLSQAADAMTGQAQEHGITITTQPSHIQVWADPDHIHQTFTNLLSNAIRFSPDGSTICLGVEAREQEIVFSVKDQGRGIPADKLEKIFERFQQVDASDSREKEGTGLGLAICHNIVKKHGGRIWVESALEQGSTFYFTLPRFQPNLADVDPLN